MCVHFVQLCGPLKLVIDTEFLVDLARQHVSINDDRVVNGIATMLLRNLVIITSTENGAEKTTYQPFNPTCSPLNPAIVLGHIRDHHFVPLHLVTGIIVLSDFETILLMLHRTYILTKLP